MNINNITLLKELTVKGEITLKRDSNYAQEIYNANIPYRPGIYLVFSLNQNGSDKDLLYYGKSGVTNYSDKPTLNFHQLPLRLLATTKIPVGHPEYDPKLKKDITRAKLWPWYVVNKFKHGIKIYWYITEWPDQNPNTYENRIKEYLKDKFPEWKKSL